MKAKNRMKYLIGKQNWWDKLPKDVQAATTRPGSVKTT